MKPSRMLARLNGIMLAIGGLILAAMAIHVIADVSCRYFLGHPLHGTTEIVSRYYMVAVIFLPLAFLQARDGHIVASLLSDALPPRALPLLTAFSALLMGIFAALLAWRCGIEAIRATEISEQIQTAYYFLPTWPARWIIPVAAVLLVAQAIASFADDIRRFIHFDPAVDTTPPAFKDEAI